MKIKMDKKYTIDDLKNIIVTLRGENGCPWDKVQTHQSIKKSLIEECYEAIDALDNGTDKDFANFIMAYKSFAVEISLFIAVKHAFAL